MQKTILQTQLQFNKNQLKLTHEPQSKDRMYACTHFYKVVVFLIYLPSILQSNFFYKHLFIIYFLIIVVRLNHVYWFHYCNFITRSRCKHFELRKK